MIKFKLIKSGNSRNLYCGGIGLAGAGGYCRRPRCSNGSGGENRHWPVSLNLLGIACAVIMFLGFLFLGIGSRLPVDGALAFTLTMPTIELKAELESGSSSMDNSLGACTNEKGPLTEECRNSNNIKGLCNVGLSKYRQRYYRLKRCANGSKGRVGNE